MPRRRSAHVVAGDSYPLTALTGYLSGKVRKEARRGFSFQLMSSGKPDEVLLGNGRGGRPLGRMGA